MADLRGGSTVSGYKIWHTGDFDINDYLLVTDIDDSPVNGVLTAPISSNWAYDHAADQDAHWTAEALQDLVGAMVASNTETGISVTYDDGAGKLNFANDTYDGDDRAVNTSGANVIDTLTLTTDDMGHVVDASATTRALTLTDIGYTGWTYAIGGTSYDAIGNGEVLNFVAGSGISIGRTGENTIQIESTATTINSLGDIEDVTITSIESGHILEWNGSAWVNTEASVAPQTEYDNGNSGTSITIDLSQSKNHKLTVTGDCTVSYSNREAGNGYRFKLVQDATGGRSITLPSGNWPGGIVYDSSAASANQIDFITMYDDGTDLWYSVVGMDYGSGV